MRMEVEDKWLSRYINFSAILMLICLIVLILVPSITGEFPTWWFFILVYLLVKIFVTVGCVLIQTQRTEKKLKDRMYQIGGVFKKYNSGIRGITWVVGKYGSYIGLRLDFMAERLLPGVNSDVQPFGENDNSYFDSRRASFAKPDVE